MNFMYFLAILIGPLMKVLYSFIGNYAVTIIVATIIMKLLLFPLAIHQQKSSKNTKTTLRNSRRS